MLDEIDAGIARADAWIARAHGLISVGNASSVAQEVRSILDEIDTCINAWIAWAHGLISVGNASYIAQEVTRTSAEHKQPHDITHISVTQSLRTPSVPDQVEADGPHLGDDVHGQIPRQNNGVLLGGDQDAQHKRDRDVLVARLELQRAQEEACNVQAQTQVDTRRMELEQQLAGYDAEAGLSKRSLRHVLHRYVPVGPRGHGTRPRNGPPAYKC
jgi:hypothetical protein